MKPIVGHYFAADKCLERQCGKHIKSEAAELWLAIRAYILGRDISYKRAMLTMILSLGKLFKRFP